MKCHLVSFMTSDGYDRNTDANDLMQVSTISIVLSLGYCSLALNHQHYLDNISIYVFLFICASVSPYDNNTI